MGNDQSGGFHPPKGQPSAANKHEGMGVSSAPADKLEEFLDRDDQYMLDEETLDPSVPVRHPNRNVDKGQGSFRGKTSTPPGDKVIDMNTADDVKTEPEELESQVTKNLFAELAEYRSDCCVTFYIPTHESGVEVNQKQDAIVFKNALRDVSKQLTEQGVPQEKVEKMLTPGYELLGDDQFWARMRQGLAVFIAEDYFKYIKMVSEPEHSISARKQFYLSPLLETMACKEYFYLLVLSKHKCKLFKADACGMEFVPIPDLPEDMMDVKRLSEKDASTVRIGVSSGGASNFHGMAGGNPDDKDNVAVYFEAVDDIIYKEILHNENVPLVLAGVEYLIPIYKGASDYRHIWPEVLTGSHEHDETNELYKKAKELVKSYFAAPRDTALTMYANQSATELTSASPNEVIPAAYYGRVSHIFVRKGDHLFGTFDELNNVLEMSNGEEDNAIDLVDEAVIKTLANGGEAYILPQDEMPGDTPLAAVFRY